MCSSRNCLVHRARRARQQALRALRLREGDHVAERLGAGHQRDEAVQAEGDAAVRRRAVLQRVEQEAELGLRLFGADVQRAEHLALHLFAVDTHRAAADLPAVEHHVVGLGDAAPGSVSSQSSWPSFGAVNGWCTAFQRRPRRRTRTSGSRPPTAAPIRPRTGRGRGRSRCGRSSRAARRCASLTTLALSAPKNSRSPLAAPVRRRISAALRRAGSSRSGLQALAALAASLTLIQASPLAP
jgi:hypothetical protein